MTKQELKKTYAALSTPELLEIVDRKFEYTDLAVSVALAELASRQVSEQDIIDYKEMQVGKAERYIKRNIVDDLTLLQKNLFYFLFIPVINFALRQNFRDDGYILKLKQANYYSFVGFIFLALSVFLSVYFDLPDLTTLACWLIGFIPAYAFDEKFNRHRQIRRLQRMFMNAERAAENQDDQGAPQEGKKV